MNSQVAILILAAGSSSRMGKIKQLLPWKGSTLLENTIRTAKSSMAGEVLVILGSNAGLIKESIHNINDVNIIENTKWRKGIGSSISCGINYLTAYEKDIRAVIILLADQVLINSEYLNRMIELYTRGKKDLIATKYGHKTGVPALFDQFYFKDLSKLDEDHGAHNLLKRFTDKIYTLDTFGKTFDVDTQEDYNKLLEMNANKDKRF
ncbi:nucleotidyltransferase family protein [uncultured Eudoraea sp.]|uniref:nucleotidyltransferase family protein n=1 Tax=uncultured Eudoraea sp. TaxID=1035614 RepID=UPI002633D061|nr:nucleotidyltransferase family protein [uncultured Eudoraea sp.]